MGASDTTERDWEEHYKELKGRADAYNDGYSDAIDKIDEILNADMTISEVVGALVRFVDDKKGRNRNDLDREKSV